MTTDKQPGERRFSSGAWLTLAAAVFILLGAITSLAIRMIQPTDGWLVINDSTEGFVFVFYQNVVGGKSDLQRDDVLLAIDGLDIRDQTDVTALLDLPRPENWQIGGQANYTVQRGDQVLTIPVPLVHWRPVDIFTKMFAAIEILTGALGSLILVLVGFYTFLRRPDLPSARALLIFSAAYAAPGIVGLLPDGVSVLFNPLALWLTLLFGYAIFGAVLAPALLSLSLLFPQPKRVVRSYPWLAYLPYGLGVIVLLVVTVGNWGTFGWLMTALMFFTSILSLVHSGFTQRDAVSRAQLRWAIGGFALGVGTALLTFPAAFGWITNPFLEQLFGGALGFGFTFVGVCLAIAILRYRLFDIDIIIRRTLQYSLLTGLLALVYFGSVLVGQRLAGAVTGESDSPLVLVVSTLVIAALFNPLRARIQDFIDRRFYRRKYDALQTVAAFTQTARDETHLDELVPALLGAVQDSVQPEQAWLWLKPKGLEKPDRF